MKLIIAGSRIIHESEAYEECVKWIELNTDIIITEVVSGTARGVDRAGETFAEDKNIPVKRFPANWDLYGKSAGYKRNLLMGEYADSLLLIWDGKSKGSGHMKSIMNKFKKPIYEIILDTSV